MVHHLRKQLIQHRKDLNWSSIRHLRQITRLGKYCKDRLVPICVELTNCKILIEAIKDMPLQLSIPMLDDFNDNAMLICTFEIGHVLQTLVQVIQRELGNRREQVLWQYIIIRMV